MRYATGALCDRYATVTLRCRRLAYIITPPLTYLRCFTLLLRAITRVAAIA